MNLLKSLLTFILLLTSLNVLAKKEGRFERIILEDFKNEKFHLEFLLKDEKTKKTKKLKIKDQKLVEGIHSGQLVSIVEGASSSSEEIDVASISAIETSTVQAATINRTAMFVVVNFADVNAFMNKEQIDALVPKVKQTYIDSSYGKFQYDFDKDGDGAHDIEQVFIDRNVLGGGCNFYYQWRDLVLAELDAQGVNYAGYTSIVMYFPKASDLGCNGLGGLGTVGTPQLYQYNYQLFSWIFDEFHGDHVVTTHEMGHNNGLGHAEVDANNDGTSESTYGDRSSFMGNGKVVNMHLPNMQHTGFFDEHAHSILTVDKSIASANYDLAALDINPLDTSLPNGIRIFKQNDTDGQPIYYYLSYRRNTNGMDLNLPSTYLTGINIYKARHKAKYNDAVSAQYVKTLSDGGVFEDTALQLKITQLGRANGVLQLKIEQGGSTLPPPPTCTPAAPALTLSAASLSFGYNETKNITVTLKNNDDVYCTDTTFDLKALMPAGVTVDNASQVIVLAPGASVQKVLKITSMAQAVSASASIRVEDNDGKDPAHVAVAKSLSIEVKDNSTPAVPLAPTDLTGRLRKGSEINLKWLPPSNANGIVAYRIYREDNGQMWEVSAATFQLNVQMPTGVSSVSFVARSVNAQGLESADSNSVTLVVKSGTSGGGGKGRNK